MTAMLRATGLRVGYGSRIVLDHVSVEIDAAGLVAILGPNGSGKTTLLKALAGLLPIAAGQVAWSGDPTTVRDPRALARQVAYLAQSPTAIPGQVVSQAILAGRFSRRGVFDFLDHADDADVVQAVAKELSVEDLLARPVDSLSGGQRQRVFLARCLAQVTPAILLDEPATYLDVRHQIEVYGRLRRLAREQGKLILMASHDLNLAATHADRMLVMNAGRIVADGPPAEILTESLLESTYGVRMERFESAGGPVFVPRV